jgi:hypothetical protein
MAMLSLRARDALQHEDLRRKDSQVNGIRTAGVAYQPQTGSVAFTEPPLSPPVAQPFAAVPVQARVPVGAPVAQVAQVAQVAPVSQPEPPAAALAAAPPQPAEAVHGPAPLAPPDESVAVFVHLSSGERVWAGRFDSGVIAEQRALDIVRALNRPEPGVWARFGNRLIRPEAVVSIELAPRREE